MPSRRSPATGIRRSDAVVAEAADEVAWSRFRARRRMARRSTGHQPQAGRGAATPPPPAPVPIPPANYVRGWRIPGSSLERALGRPIRDQVYSTRDNQATTIQALELVNGDTLTHWLARGARKMLGE